MRCHSYVRGNMLLDAIATKRITCQSSTLRENLILVYQSFYCAHLYYPCPTPFLYACQCVITITCSFSVYPLITHLYTIKLGYTGVYNFSYFGSKTDCAYSLEHDPTIYVFSITIQNINVFQMEFSIFAAKKSLYIACVRVS